jgi:dTDP-glucose pyrophosphorylase
MPEQPIYKRPDIKYLMAELIAAQGVAEAVIVVFEEEDGEDN